MESVIITGIPNLMLQGLNPSMAPHRVYPALGRSGSFPLTPLSHYRLQQPGYIPTALPPLPQSHTEPPWAVPLPPHSFWQAWK